tara:strand:+ start:13540 stop:13803 length:264 start_codon:yes stop_codon:yes gene_type:complete
VKKQIWHIEVKYEWNTWRVVKGIRKDTKKTNEGIYETCAVGDTVQELNKNIYLISCIKNKIKSSQNVEVKITGWNWREEMGMTNDVH